MEILGEPGNLKKFKGIIKGMGSFGQFFAVTEEFSWIAHSVPCVHIHMNLNLAKNKAGSLSLHLYSQF